MCTLAHTLSLHTHSHSLSLSLSLSLSHTHTHTHTHTHMRVYTTKHTHTHTHTCCTGGLLAMQVAATSAALHLRLGAVWPPSRTSSVGNPPMVCRSAAEKEWRGKGVAHVLVG